MDNQTYGLIICNIINTFVAKQNKTKSFDITIQIILIKITLGLVSIILFWQQIPKIIIVTIILETYNWIWYNVHILKWKSWVTFFIKLSIK